MKRNSIFALLLIAVLVAGCSAPATSQTSVSQSDAPVSSTAPSQPESGSATASIPSSAIATAPNAVLEASDLPFSDILPSTWHENIYAWIPGGSFDLHIPPAPEDAGMDIAITAAQQKNIIAQFQGLAAKYAAGEYPLPAGEATDHTPFAAKWPDNVAMEISAQPDEIYYCSTTNVMTFNVGVYFMLDDKWLMCASVVPGGNAEGTVTDSLADDYWYIDPQYSFMSR